MHRLIFIASLAVLASCASSTSQQSSIAALEVGLSTAETAALAYKGLPVCGSVGASAICSETDVVNQIKTADNVAYSAVKAAEASAAGGASVDLTAATAALTGLQSIVLALPKGN